MTICNADHCPHRAIRRGLCDEHARQQGRAKSKRRGYSAHAAGYDAAWEKIKRRVLREQPMCARNCGSASVDVHHIDHEGPRGTGGNHRSNLEAMCHECHAARTRRRQLSA